MAWTAGLGWLLVSAVATAQEASTPASGTATTEEQTSEAVASPEQAERGGETAAASAPASAGPSAAPQAPADEQPSTPATASPEAGASAERAAIAQAAPTEAPKTVGEEKAAEGQRTEGEAALPLTWHASMVTRYELRDGYAAIARTRAVHPFAYDGDYVSYRARFGLETKPLRLDDGLRVLVRFMPQSSGYWNVGGDTLQDAGLDLHEGYLQIMGEDWSLRSGRFEIVYGDHFVVGNVGWHWTSRSFDALRFRKQLGKPGAWFDLFASLLDEGRARGIDEVGVQDTWFGGFYGSFGPLLREGLALDGYLLYQFKPEWRVADSDPTDTVDDSYHYDELRFTLGARSKARFGAFDYRTEVGLQLGFTGPAAAGGANRSILAYQGDLEVGYHAGPVRLALEGFYASGDDPSTADTVEGWNMLYPTAHKWLGLMDILFVRTNVYGGVLHLKAKAADSLSLFLDGHYFARPQDGMDSGVARRAGTVAYEVDLGGKYVLAPGLHTRLGYSIYLPQQSYYGVSDPVHFFELELKYQH